MAGPFAGFRLTLGGGEDEGLGHPLMAEEAFGEQLVAVGPDDRAAAIPASFSESPHFTLGF